MAREFFIVHSDITTDAWCYENKESAEKRLSSGLKAPSPEFFFKISHVRVIEPMPDDVEKWITEMVREHYEKRDSIFEFGVECARAMYERMQTKYEISEMKAFVELAEKDKKIEEINYFQEIRSKEILRLNSKIDSLTAQVELLENALKKYSSRGRCGCTEDQELEATKALETLAKMRKGEVQK